MPRLNVKFIKTSTQEYPELVLMYTDQYDRIESFASGLFLPPNVESLKSEDPQLQKGIFYIKEVYKKLEKRYGESIFILYCPHLNDRAEILTKIEEVSHMMFWLDNPDYGMCSPDEEHFFVRELATVIKDTMENDYLL